MSGGDELDISGDIFKRGTKGAPGAVDDEYSGAIDLSDLIANMTVPKLAQFVTELSATRLRDLRIKYTSA